MTCWFYVTKEKLIEHFTNRLAYYEDLLVKEKKNVETLKEELNDHMEAHAAARAGSDKLETQRVMLKAETSVLQAESRVTTYEGDVYRYKGLLGLVSGGMYLSLADLEELEFI